MKSRFANLWTKVVLLLSLIACPSVPALAQGCALCYTQAAGASPRTIQALRSGIMVLISPPLAIGIGLVAMSFKKRNNFADSSPKSTQHSALGEAQRRRSGVYPEC